MELVQGQLSSCPAITKKHYKTPHGECNKYASIWQSGSYGNETARSGGIGGILFCSKALLYFTIRTLLLHSMLRRIVVVIVDCSERYDCKAGAHRQFWWWPLVWGVRTSF